MRRKKTCLFCKRGLNCDSRNTIQSHKQKDAINQPLITICGVSGSTGFLNSATLVTIISNAYDDEFELQATPTRGFDIFADVGVTRAQIGKWAAREFNDDDTALIQYNYEGKYLPDTPWVYLQYRRP